ncbi:hypothetical protein [Deinococcus multiflagellatus]|uniref:PEGA domain-containing protein n=1 Tax=Deinococcus multiflagellatus TaxID=1656887 RepID=A0ABW1ZPS4_9DEIO
MGGQARPEDDLYALAVILNELGGLPRALSPLVTHPGTLSAAQALALLNRDAEPPTPVPAAPVQVTPIPVTPVPAAPAAPVPAPSAPEPGAPAPAAAQPPAPQPLTPDPVPVVHDGTRIVLGPASAAPPPAAPSGPETPQERRRRENDARRAQAALDAQAAAARKAEARRAEAARAPGATVPAPVQIGFEDDLPTWAPGEAPAEAPGAARVTVRDVERLPASLRRPQAPAPAPPEPAPSRLPRRTAAEPIRIGWDEDDSWRVVREAPAPAPRPTLPEWAKPEWFGPRRAVAVLAALLALWGGWWVLSHRQPQATAPTSTPTPAVTAPCCEVRVTVRGAAGVDARLSVIEAPSSAGLTRGQDLGRAPGVLRLPVPGTYRLRVAADGWSPATLTVTVPRTQPVTIDLSD